MRRLLWLSPIAGGQPSRAPSLLEEVIALGYDISESQLLEFLVMHGTRLQKWEPFTSELHLRMSLILATNHPTWTSAEGVEMLRGLRLVIPRILDNHWPEALYTYDFLGNAVLLAEQGNFLSMILPWAVEQPPAPPAQETAPSHRSEPSASSTRVPTARSARHQPARQAGRRSGLPVCNCLWACQP